MAAKSIYDVVAFDSNGAIVYSERTTTKASANKLAREFMPYVNVFTCDIIRNGQNVARYVKLSSNNGVVIANGITKNIRF
jgi:hypothetical protein